MFKVKTMLVYDGPDASPRTQTCDKVEYKGSFLVITNVREEGGCTIVIPASMLCCPALVWKTKDE